MKQQITAVIENMKIDNKVVELPEQADVVLEFSAVDTGGGFRDPILDFTYQLPVLNNETLNESMHSITLLISDPSDFENTLLISYNGKLEQVDGDCMEAMGRLQGKEAGGEILEFVMRCLR